MKKFIIVILLLISASIFAQQGSWNEKNITWQDTERKFKEYIPNTYNSDNPTAILFLLHGLGGTMDDFDNTKICYLAASKGWILIAPEAMSAKLDIPGMGEYNVGNAWNSGAGQENIQVGVITFDEVYFSKDVDDVGFLLKILEDYKAQYAIDDNKVFFSGFSMGGFMSHRIAIQAGDKISAIATVAGTIGHFQEFNPTNKMNVLHIHGTEDPTVGYDNADLKVPILPIVVEAVGTGAEETVEKWRAFNECGTEPVITEYPDLINDGLKFTKFAYSNPQDNILTEFIKADGGIHEYYFTPQNDIDYMVEIVEFLSRVNAEPSSLNVDVLTAEINVFPNPAYEYIEIQNSSLEDMEFSLFNLLGEIVMSKTLTSTLTKVNLSEINQGLYVAVFRKNDFIKSVEINVLR